MFSSSSKIKNEKGQGLVEYAIILALIAIVVIGVTTKIGKKVCNTMSGVGNSLDSSSSSNNCSGTSSSGTVYQYGGYYNNQTQARDSFCYTAVSGAPYTIYQDMSMGNYYAGTTGSGSKANGSWTQVGPISSGTCP